MDTTSADAPNLFVRGVGAFARMRYAKSISDQITEYIAIDAEGFEIIGISITEPA